MFAAAVFLCLTGKPAAIPGSEHPAHSLDCRSGALT
jgi:hypothetical protein